LQKGKQAAESINVITEITKDYQDMGEKPPKWQNIKMAMLLGLSHIPLGEVQHSIETGNLEIFADLLLEKAFQRLFESSLTHGVHVTHTRVWYMVTPDDLTIFFIETPFPAQAAFSGYGFTVCLPQMSFVIFSSIMVCDNGCPPFQ
jgi:hypothetical protein